MERLHGEDEKSNRPTFSVSRAGGIPITEFPKQAHESLRYFDSDGDGKVSPLELARAAEAWKAQRKLTSRLTKVAMALAAAFIVLSVTNMGTSYIAYKLSKDTVVSHIGANVELTDSAGSQ